MSEAMKVVYLNLLVPGHKAWYVGGGWMELDRIWEQVRERETNEALAALGIRDGD